MSRLDASTSGRKGALKSGRFAPRPKQVLVGLLAAFLLAGVLVGIGYARTSIPNPSTIASQQTTKIYYSTGQLLATLGETNRTDVPLSEVPPWVQHAVLAAEDRHFYSEPGVSPTGIMRALFVDLKGGDISQGGSTITQQYVKNAYLSPHRTLTRKLNEILIATKLAQERSKSTILTDYLNTIYFGRNAYGIQAASKAYFGRPVSQLTVSQGALLAAVINAPSYYDPVISKQNLVNAKARWQYVINGMVSQGWLTSAQAGRQKFPSRAANQKDRDKYAGKFGGAGCTTGWQAFVCNAVEAELVNHDGLSQAQLDLGGYKVTTTISKPMQDAAVAAEHNFNMSKTKHEESALISVQPGTGAIEAMYGGKEYCKHETADDCKDLTGEDSDFARPPGSSMKPYTLIAALKQGYSLNSIFSGPSHIPFPGTADGISNSGGEVCGRPCTLVRALAQSINTVFVPLAKDVGPTNVDKVAYAAGIPTTAHLSTFPEVTLGTEPVSPLDQAVGYATIAAQGVHASPYLVQSVKTARGSTIYKAHPKTDRAFPADVASDATYAMTKVLSCSFGGTACGKELSGRPAAGKTGTTTNNTDAWFIGFTPQLSTAVWIGNDTKHSLQPVTSGGLEVYGGDIPAQIWQSMMNAALQGVPVVQFPPAANVGTPHDQVTPSATATATTSTTPTSTPTTTPTITPSETPTITPSGTPSETPSVTPTATSTGLLGGGGGGPSPPAHTRRRQRNR
jgi:membrane peptidoglycan carboxypeptidase